MKPHRLLAASAALAVAALAQFGGTPSPASSRCSDAAGARPILRSDDALIYARNGADYVCVPATGALRRLGDSRSIRFPQLAGAYVGFERQGSGGRSEVVVVDVSQQGSSRSLPAPGSVGSIALTGSGTVAWISTALDGSGLVVHEASTERDELLDRGTDIDAGSLATSSDQLLLYWKRGGEARFAPLR